MHQEGYVLVTTLILVAVKGMHGFYLDSEKRQMRFDVVISFDADDRKAVYDAIVEDVQKAFPDYELRIAMDLDFS